MAAVEESVQTLGGGKNPESVSLLSEARSRKFDLLTHLAANLSQPIVVSGPEGMGKTVFLRGLAASVRPYATVCYLAATPGMSYEMIIEALRRAAIRDSDATSANAAGFSELMARYASERRLLLLMLDNADVLLPGLLSALWEFARLNPSLHLVLALPSSAWDRKSASDASAFRDAQPLEIPSLSPAEFAAFLRQLAVDRPELSARCASAEPCAAAWHSRVQGAPGAMIRWLEKPSGTDLTQNGSRSTRWWVSGLAILALLGGVYQLWKPGTQKEAPVSRSQSTLKAEADSASPLILKEPGGTVLGLPPAAVATGKLPPMDSDRASIPEVPAIAPPRIPPNQGAPDQPPREPALAAESGDSVSTKPPEPSAKPENPIASGNSGPPKSEPRPSVGQPETPATIQPGQGENSNNGAAAADPEPEAKSMDKSPEQLARIRAASVTGLEGARSADWLLEQNPDAYTLQLVAMSQANALAGTIGRFPPDSLLAAFRSRKGRGDLYILFYGIFPNMAAAREGATALPAALGHPIPRQFKSIRDEILGVPVTRNENSASGMSRRH